MRVVHVIPTVARSAGGPSEVVRELLPRLIRDGIEVVLVTTDKGNSADDSDVAAWPYARVARSGILPRWTFSLGIVRHLWREIGACDIVHVHSVHTFPSTMAMMIARLKRRPVVLQPHGALNSYHLGQGRNVKLAYLRMVDAVGLGSVRAAVYSSDFELRDGAGALPNIAGWRIPLGVDDEILKGPRSQAAKPRVTFLGRLAKKKRVDLLLAAFATPALRDREFDAIVAGPVDGDLTFDPQELANSFDVSDRVEFVGKLGRSDRAQLLAGSDIFVLPSDDESFGMAVAEAMGAGCAVVSTTNVGVAWDARGDDAVMLVDQSPLAIAEAIQVLLEQPCQRAALGRRARDYARSHLSWDAVSMELIRNYCELIRASFEVERMAER